MEFGMMAAVGSFVLSHMVSPICETVKSYPCQQMGIYLDKVFSHQGVQIYGTAHKQWVSSSRLKMVNLFWAGPRGQSKAYITIQDKCNLLCLYVCVCVYVGIYVCVMCVYTYTHQISQSSHLRYNARSYFSTCNFLKIFIII